jgi:ribosome biogenesis GTPase
MKDFIHHEESDYFNIRKDGRKDRKMAQKGDRSKYKKTDQDKLQKQEKKELPLAPEDYKEGIVTMIRPEQFFVDCQGTSYVCSLRGALKKESHKLKTLVIVGDKVQFEQTGPQSGVIVSVLERKTVLSRKDHLSQIKEHLIAANVDQVFITVSVMDPPLRLTIVDRYLIAAEKGGLKPIIVCNKIDLLDDESYPEEQRLAEREILEECIKVYPSLNIPFIAASAKTGAGIDTIKEMMKDRVSVFSGQSGTGKSSIINEATDMDLKVGKTVAATRKGSHTTTYTQLLPLSFGGWCIDTPGIKSFGVWDLKEQDLRNYFEEIQEAATKCKFPDCRHLEEPGCALPEAIEEGKVSILRFNSYLSLLASLQQEHTRR